ncbi:MAG: phosphatase PAP2 family protein [Candidatus Gastranaerophilales bacterium]|nr:phosphatase PAP2 family protein [Candidatus Gastranaerophilales bacterium]
MVNSTLEKINNIDINILRFINRKISNRTLNLLLPPLTNKYKFHYLAEILGLYLYLHITKKPEKFINIMLIFSEAFTATVLIKFIIRHKRPFVNYKDIIDRDGDFPNVGAEEFKIDNEIIKSNRNSWYSFPSTEAATSIVLLKSFFKPEINITNTLLISYFSLILFSRMYNGMHRPLDILFGSLLGWFWPVKKEIL